MGKFFKLSEFISEIIVKNSKSIFSSLFSNFFFNWFSNKLAYSIISFNDILILSTSIFLLLFDIKSLNEIVYPSKCLDLLKHITKYFIIKLVLMIKFTANKFTNKLSNGISLTSIFMIELPPPLWLL